MEVGGGEPVTHMKHRQGGVPQGRRSPEPPPCLLSIPSCPAHTMLLVARAWRGLSPTFSTASSPWSHCAWGRGAALGRGHSPSSHGSQWGRAELSRFPGEEWGAGPEGLGPGPLTGAPCGRTRFKTPSLRMALSSFGSKPNSVLGHPGSEIRWGPGWAVCCGSAVSCPSLRHHHGTCDNPW